MCCVRGVILSQTCCIGGSRSRYFSLLEKHMKSVRSQSLQLEAKVAVTRFFCFTNNDYSKRETKKSSLTPHSGNNLVLLLKLLLRKNKQVNISWEGEERFPWIFCFPGYASYTPFYDSFWQFCCQLWLHHKKLKVIAWVKRNRHVAWWN